MPIRRDSEIELMTVEGPQVRQLADKIHHAVSQQRLSAGNADFLNPLGDEEPHHSEIVCHRQVSVDRALIPGTAIDTLVVAAIGDRDPQIGDGAAVLVSEADCVSRFWLLVSRSNARFPNSRNEQRETYSQV